MEKLDTPLHSPMTKRAEFAALHSALSIPHLVSLARQRHCDFYQFIAMES